MLVSVSREVNQSGLGTSSAGWEQCEMASHSATYNRLGLPHCVSNSPFLCRAAIYLTLSQSQSSRSPGGTGRQTSGDATVGSSHVGSVSHALATLFKVIFLVSEKTVESARTSVVLVM
jgi:hypothetical protein